MLPFEDEELRAWDEAERKRGGDLGPLPPKDVNVTAFVGGVFECSCAVLEWLVFQIGANLEKEQPSPPTTPVAVTPSGSIEKIRKVSCRCYK